MRAAGRWGWCNNYATMPPEQIVERALAAQLDGLILKLDDPDFERTVDACLENEVNYAVENYVYEGRAYQDGKRLGKAYTDYGARFIVVNAEHGSGPQEARWETATAAQAGDLIAGIWDVAVTAEIYASVDTRGHRPGLPYQQVFNVHCTAFMPMVYPKAFYPLQEPGYVERAFEASLRAFRTGVLTLPALPTFQCYDSIGADAVAAQIVQAKLEGSLGYSFYTTEHATEEEWQEVVEDVPTPGPGEWSLVDVLTRLDKVLWAVQDLQAGLRHIFQRGWKEYERGEYARPPWPPVWPE